MLNKKSLIHHLFLLCLTICGCTTVDWNRNQECWTKKGGVCVKNDKNFQCPFSQSVTWWKGCPSGYKCCIPHHQCGFRRLSKTTFTNNRVLGGYEVKRGEYPWQALIRLDGYSHCGGVIIADRWILTAAHCIYFFRRRDLFSVETGMVDLLSSESTQKPKIDQIILHESFDPALFTNDVALIKLKSSLTFDDFTSPICLPKKGDTFQDGICTVSGWGWYRRINRRKLVGLNLPIIPYKRCLRTVKSEYIDKHNLCAGFRSEKHDDCQGDTGGPLGCRMGSGQWVLAGIVSSSGMGCGLSGKPIVFTKMTSFFDWITYRTSMTWT